MRCRGLAAFTVTCMNLFESASESSRGAATKASPPFRKTVTVIGGIVFASTLTLTGCSAAATHTATSSGLPAKNINQWVLPLDSYVVGNTKNSDYAQGLLVEPCMEKAGYTWNVPYRDTSATDGPSWNSAERRLFNPAIAQKWGFHLAPSPDTTLEALKSFIASANAVGPAESAAVTKCVVDSRKELPVLSGAAQLGSSYASQAYDGALTDAAVKAGASKWRTCMAPAGVSDLPNTPEEFPSPSVVAKFNIKLELSHTPPSVSPAEIKLATFEANCEVTSGYQAALYKAEWDRQVTLMNKNADDLQRAKSQLDKHNTQIVKVISTHAPKH